jgi:glycosyltransferase involved in cell wall biosynthesis
VHPFAAWAASRLARRHAAAFVYEIRDFWPQTLIDIGSLSSLHPAAAVMRHLERTLCARAARIVSPLPHAARYLVPRGVPASKIACIPNGVDLDLFPPPAPRLPEPTFTFMYFGAHGRANGLDRLLDAMAHLNVKAPDASIRLRMVGSGPEKPRLVERAERMGLTGVVFEDPVAKTGVADLGASTDAFIFNLERLDVFRFGISSNKLFDYMACGRPIVFCATAPNDVVTEAGAGIAAAPDAESLADAMLALSRMPPARLREMGVAARTFVEENYAMPSLAARLAAVLDAVAPDAQGERRRHDHLDEDLPETADTGSGRPGAMHRRIQDGFRVKA